MEQVKNDPASFIFRQNGSLEGFICLNVDDSLHAGSQKMQIVLEELEKRVTIGSKKCDDFIFCGVRIKDGDEETTLDQFSYIDSMTIPKFDFKGREESSNATDEEKESSHLPPTGWADQLGGMQYVFTARMLRFEPGAGDGSRFQSQTRQIHFKHGKMYEKARLSA